MENKNKGKKSKIIFWSAIGVLIILLVVFGVFAKPIFGEDSQFAIAMDRNVGDILNIGRFFSNRWPTIIRTLTLIVVVYVITVIVRFLVKALLSKGKRRRTISGLVDSVIKYVSAIILILLILAAWGVDTAALLAGVGILGLVVGLGAQSLIADIIAGLFIIFENEYQVGDIVVIDQFRGTVHSIGVRTTQIIDAGGDIKIVNNSDIRNVINMTSDLSLAICDVSIEYGESLQRVENVIDQNLERIKENVPLIVEGPYYKGVAELAASGVVIRIIARCLEEDKYQTVRDLNRQLKLIFDENNIQIPFPQIVLNKPEENKKIDGDKEAADEFLKEQSKLSKHLGEEDK